MKKRGFTLIEVTISLVIFSIIMASAMAIFFNSNKVKQTTENLAEMQQIGRNAIDFLSREIRSTGYEVDISKSTVGTAQPAIAYASGYTYVFNANLDPSDDQSDNPSAPTAYKPSVASADSINLSNYNYSTSVYYETGAETYVYTLDINGDGQINDEDANYSGSPSAKTPNPNDFTLVRCVYGFDSTAGNNLRSIEYIGLVQGPSSEHPPLFWYWYDDDDDPSTPDKLWGDSNNNGLIDVSEISAANTAVSASAKSKIRKITLYYLVGSSEPVNGKYYETPIITTISVNRNMPMATYPVYLHVYEDADENGNYDSGETGLSGFKIILNTGDIATTNSSGEVYFELSSGEYIAMVEYDVEWMPTTNTSKHFFVLNDGVDLTEDTCFGFKEWPVASVTGKVWYDENNNGLYDTGEVLVPNVLIEGTDVDNIYTDETGVFTSQIKAQLPRTIYPSLPDTMGLSGSFVDITDDPPINLIDSLRNSDYTISVNVGESGFVCLWFGITNTIGIPCTVNMIAPHENEGLRQTQTYPIQWTANGVDDSILGAWLYYSPNEGENWQEINYIPGIGDTLWNGTYYWYISEDFTPSINGMIRIRVTDAGHNIDEDTVNIILSPKAGFTTLFFTRSYPDDINWSFPDSNNIYILRPSSWDTSQSNYTDIDDTLYPRLMRPDLGEDTIWGISYATVPQSRLTLFKFPMRFPDLDTPSEWITGISIPNADTIFKGPWTFILSGAHQDSIDDSRCYYKFQIKVSKRDSSGNPYTDQLLFDTRYTTNIDSVKWVNLITNIDVPETIYVFPNKGFSMYPTDRLYFRLYLEAVPAARGSVPDSVEIPVHFMYTPWNETFNSRVILPQYEY